jgi:gliding motility-associatede transport system auxiliary component
MKTKRAQAIGRASIILGILVVVNFISVRVFSRLDLTKEGVYTLSDASKKLIGSLDDRLTIKAYFTDDLPSPYNDNRRMVLDMLDDYKAYSNGNLQFEFISPEGDKGEQEAQQQGIPPVEVQVVKQDRFEVKKAYMGLELLYEDKKETIPVIQNLSSLEYDISSAIQRLTTKVKKKIGYTQGHGEPAISTMSEAEQELSKQYDLVPVYLSKNPSVPADLTALLIIAPDQKFSDSAKFAIDQYLMSGGKIAFLLNKVTANLQQRYAEPINLGLEDMLEDYGIRINGDLVRDAQCANITVMQQEGPFQMQSQIPFPYLVNASNFDKSNPIVKDFQSLIFYFVSSLDTSLASSKGLTTDVIVRSSKRSGRQTGFMMINPMEHFTAADFPESGIPLAAIVEGSFKSFFIGKTPKPSITQSPPTRIIVVGDGDFMKNDFASARNNLTFFENIADYLADDAGLITIRSKNIEQPPLEQVSDATKQTLKYGDMLVPPLLVIGYGLFRWRKKAAMKKVFESKM